MLPVVRRPPLVLHPLVIFSAVWVGVVLLYSLHLSKILIYSTDVVTKIVFAIWAPFAGVVLGCALLRRVLIERYPSRRAILPVDLPRLERHLTIAFRAWIAITIVEIIVSGGIPIIWLAINSSKTYQDFGIPSLGGLMNSLIFAISLCRFGLFLITGERRHLRIPTFILIWSILIITRNMLLVSLIQFVILFVWFRPIKKATVAKFITGFAGLVLLFGAIGDYRSGSSDLIRVWAQPTENYPLWLPSGVLWAYIYVTTPINNLAYTVDVARPLDSIMFPNTVALLFPSIFRIIIYGDSIGDVESGQLVNKTFNVSTEYIGPYQDFGFIGIVVFSAVTAFACISVWSRTDLKSVLAYAVLGQCLVLSLFWDQFLALPVITQLIWLQVFFGRNLMFRTKAANPSTKPADF